MDIPKVLRELELYTGKRWAYEQLDGHVVFRTGVGDWHMVRADCTTEETINSVAGLSDWARRGDKQ